MVFRFIIDIRARYVTLHAAYAFRRLHAIFPPMLLATLLRRHLLRFLRCRFSRSQI